MVALINHLLTLLTFQRERYSACRNFCFSWSQNITLVTNPTRSNSENVGWLKNKYKFVMDQELMDASAHTPAGGSTLLREMTSWPPSWKCDVISKNPTINRHIFAWSTFLSNFIPFQFEMTETYGFLVKRHNGHHLRSVTSYQKSDSVNQCTFKVKRTMLHLERWWGAHLPSYGREPVGG